MWVVGGVGAYPTHPQLHKQERLCFVLLKDMPTAAQIRKPQEQQKRRAYFLIRAFGFNCENGHPLGPSLLQSFLPSLTKLLLQPPHVHAP